MLEIEYNVRRGAWLVTTDYESNYTDESIYIRNDELFEKIVEPFGTADLYKNMWKELNDYLTQIDEHTQDSDTQSMITRVQDKAKALQEKYEEMGAEFFE